MKAIFLTIIGGITLFMLIACKTTTELTTEESSIITSEQTTNSGTTNTTTTTSTTTTTTATTIVATTTQPKEETNLYYDEHTIVHRVSDFNQGELNDLVLLSDGLTLKPGVMVGSYTSPIINTNHFKQLVASWNALTPDQSFIELKVQIRQNGKWSQWLTYGKWGLETINRSVSSSGDTIAKISIDTVMTKTGYADAYRYHVTLNRAENDKQSPVVKLIAQTLQLENQVVETIDFTNVNWQTDVEVPVHSQMIVPVIGNIICSPTSLTMLMNHYGINYTPSDTAVKAYDSGANIYGNWSYNVAVAGALGLESYVSRLETIDELKLLIARNTPVAVSITVKSASQLDNLPLKNDGTSMTYPSGHLLIVRGFTVKDNVEYIIVNDPAARNNEEVNRLYKLDQFQNIWKNYVYIVKNK